MADAASRSLAQLDVVLKSTRRELRVSSELLTLLIGGLGASMVVLLAAVTCHHFFFSGSKRQEAVWRGVGDQASPRTFQTPRLDRHVITPPQSARSMIRGLLGSDREPIPPLCDPLVVPEGKRLICRVPIGLTGERQDTVFEVTSAPSRGGAPLLRVRAVELEANPRIVLEHLKDGVPLATMTTGDFHTRSFSPAFGILGPQGAAYGSIEPSGSDYVLVTGGRPVAIFEGDFAAHSVQVLNSRGQQIANVESVDDKVYQVTVESKVDFGLVLLGLLAINKREGSATSAFGAIAGATQSLFGFGGGPAAVPSTA